MKVCVSSRIIYSESWPKIKDALDAAGVESFFPKKEDFSGKDEKGSRELMKKIVARFQGFMNGSDILYVNAPRGDVSRAVSCEIGYAKAKGLRVISSEEIGELEIRVMVDKIVPVESLKEYLEAVRV